MMNLVLDPHVHLYPSYGDNFFEILCENLKNLSEGTPDATLGSILTERDDCNYYELLLNAGQAVLDKYKIQKLEKFESHLKLYLENNALIIYPGIQINTLERIEILGLFIKNRPSTKLSLSETIIYILEHGGLPVINWAPGKWTGKRAELIRQYLVREATSRECLLGISKLLSRNCSLPAICKTEGADLPLILGSDPLPFKGDEHQAGTVGLVFNDLKDLSSTEIKKRLRNKEYLITGERNGVLKSFARVLKNELARRT